MPEFEKSPEITGPVCLSSSFDLEKGELRGEVSTRLGVDVLEPAAPAPNSELVRVEICLYGDLSACTQIQEKLLGLLKPSSIPGD